VKLSIILTSLVCIVGLSNANAGPIVDGREWYQPADLYGIAWDDIAEVCDPASGVCNGSVGGHDLTGWMWADRAQANGLLNHFLVLGGVSGMDLLSGVDSYSDAQGAWAGAIYAAGFEISYETTVVYASVISGMLRERSTANEFGVASFVFDAGYSYWAISDSTSALPGGSFPSLGAWIYRESSVPAPATLSLLGLAFLMLRVSKRPLHCK